MYKQNYADRVTYYVINSTIIATIVVWLSLLTPFDHPSNNRPFTERLYYRPAEIFPVSFTTPVIRVHELPTLTVAPNIYSDGIPVEVHTVKKPAVVSKPTPPRIVDPILYRANETVTLSQQDKNCLIRNVFFEAGSEPYAGKIAVAHVTWNRVQSGQWGNTVCQVVHAPHQFSWTAESSARHRAPYGPHWEATRQAVYDFIDGRRVYGLHRSMNFHAVHVRPDWARSDRQVARIGGHVFYALN